MRHAIHALAIVAILLCGPTPPAGTTQAQSAFATQVASLSEAPGYFDTDNLISNERSYLEVVTELKKRGIRGGAYVGVGPDQNFSYIAAVRPEIAFILDIRRDNLLLHLLFKSLFELANTRLEYLTLLFGRAAPRNPDAFRDATIDRLVTQLEGPVLDDKPIAALRARVNETIARTGVPLSAEDRATIDRFHRRFIEAGINLRFQSLGRPPQSHYPTYRDLLLGTDAAGEYSNFLASEESFQFVKGLQHRDLVIPVVGDLSGPRALVAIGALLGRRGQRLSAFYASNVEFYLFGDGRFAHFAGNLRRVPRADRSVIIRSVFGRYAYGGGSTSQVQPLGELVDGVAKGRFQHYGELVSPR